MKKDKIVLAILAIFLSIAVISIGIVVMETKGDANIDAGAGTEASAQTENLEKDEQSIERKEEENPEQKGPEQTIVPEQMAQPESSNKEQMKATKEPVIEEDRKVETISSAVPLQTEAPSVKQTEIPKKQEATNRPIEATMAPAKIESKVGTITLSVDASVIGNGTLISNRKVEIYSQEMASHAVVRGLQNAGFGYSFSGSLEKDFYLSGIKKEGLIKKVAVPSHVLEILEENGVRLKLTKYNSGVLKEFDFTNVSGWRYSVNGTFPGVGMADYKLKDGDHVVLKYTLCLGYDA